ncbi:hypothetical protein ATE49_04435 [Elizabethkingia miricola]|uniref:hypothetical protein n=1 Tax=Elizabethkingia miricola TaxID=172045 RepID=UPI0007EE3438|nr:hypothetical protein [Elizabethkingia miricola]OBS12734.1 hypothetical protein ATE49_04435 [Elizabethkingia miricola]
MLKTKRPETSRLYTDVRKEYSRLSKIREYGKQKHSDAWIIARLAHKFYRSEATIENIIFNRV